MIMKKKQYMKPEQRVVVLQHMTQLLTGSPLTSTNTNLIDDDDLDIDDTPVGTGFWGR